MVSTKGNGTTRHHIHYIESTLVGRAHIALSPPCVVLMIDEIDMNHQIEVEVITERPVHEIERGNENERGRGNENGNVSGLIHHVGVLEVITKRHLDWNVETVPHPTLGLQIEIEIYEVGIVTETEIEIVMHGRGTGMYRRGN